MADKEKVIKGLQEIVDDKWMKNHADWYVSVCADALALLKECDAVEGHWIPIESFTGVEAFGIKEMTVQDVRCSVCDAEEDVSFAAYRFCPRCGAKMKGR